MGTAFGDALSALKHRDYRYYWTSQAISLAGSAMQSAALGWLVYTVTGSAAMLGSLAAFQFGPMIVLSLPAGVFIDRWPKRRVLLITQTVFMMQAFALSSLTFSGKATYRLILPLASLYGIAQAFDYPCRRSYLLDLVGSDDLQNAISLNTTASGLTRIVGPSLAGIVMARLGGGWAFFLNALSYGAVIAALAHIKIDGAPKTAPEVQKASIIADLYEGLRYVWNSAAIRVTLLMGLAVMIFGLNENVLVPVFADQTLSTGVEGYGVLMSSVAVGSLVAAVFGASTQARATGEGAQRMLIGAGIAVGATQVALFISRSFWITAILLAVVGFGGTWFSMAMYYTVQTCSEPRFRGRVSSVNAIVESGTVPIGNAIAGTTAYAWGAPGGFLLCGGMTIVALLASYVFGGRRNPDRNLNRE